MRSEVCKEKAVLFWWGGKTRKFTDIKRDNKGQLSFR